MFEFLLRVVLKALFRALTLCVGEHVPAGDEQPDRLRRQVLEPRGSEK